jgi:threonyl-tRNA synthetase
MIHRTVLGSMERFFGVLIEHYAGNFPAWLAPTQVKILPISERHAKYAESVVNRLKAEGFRVELDDRNATLPGKIRDAQMEKIPYMLIVGDKEQEASKVAVRLRDSKDLGAIDLQEFIKQIKEKVDKKSPSL